MKKNLISIFILSLALIWSILFLIQELSKDESEYLLLSIIISAAIVGFISGLFIKKYSFLDFLKILLPTSGTLIAAVWLISSGYLNIRTENLKREIFNLKNEDSVLQERRIEFQKDSVRLTHENDSLFELNELLELQVNNNSKTRIDNARLSLENKKLKNDYYLIKTINESIIQKHIANVLEVDFGSREVYFLLKNQKGKILNANEIGIECLDDTTGKFHQLDFNFETNQYFWRIPDHLFMKNNSNVELNFSFPESTSFYNQVTEFRKNNGYIEIGSFGAQYELIVFL